MHYYSKKLPNGRWGIYVELKLLATIGCYKSCQKLLNSLNDENSTNYNYSYSVKKIPAPATKTVA